MNAYVERVIDGIRLRNPNQPEFIQAAEEIFRPLGPVLDAHPEYEQNLILERLVEPDRAVCFRVIWEDDNGQFHVNRGYRVQTSSALGPYKGGLRFHYTVNMSIMKALGLEQTFKNSLTGLPMGGGKGGADFDPRGKSDREIMRFCQAYMNELYRHIGGSLDVPAGDLGCGAKEIGYLFGQYKRIKNIYDNGALTGKHMNFGGSHIRPEATGFGATYYVKEVMEHNGDTFAGKTFALSGFGNVCWGAASRITDFGGKVVTISGPDGYIYDPDGISTPEKLNFLLEMRNSRRDCVKDYADKFGVQFFPGQKPWGVKADVVMPCATQNEVGMEEAKKIVAAGVKYYIEVSNMPTTNEALSYLMEQESLIVAPSKAVNAGGVAVSGLEMSQNAMRLQWSPEEVDERLAAIMKNIHDQSAKCAEEYGYGYNLVAGANIFGFLKIADAMIAQGLV